MKLILHIRVCTMIYTIISLIRYTLFINFPFLAPACQNLIIFGNPKAQLEEAEEESLSPEAKMQADITLFHSLFPDVKAQDIPKEVWDSVEEGESLAASYSLYAVKTFREEERIRKVNEENDKKAAPRVQSDPGGEEYFSPEAVKQMTRAEIRKNYNKILTSMEKWN